MSEIVLHEQPFVIPAERARTFCQMNLQDPEFRLPVRRDLAYVYYFVG
jgi:hypothetical protein